MTDNRTTELRAKLTERGVDWLDESNDYADVTTFIANGAKWTVISRSYLNPEHDWMTLRAEHITPEQAIAATLGSGTLTAEQVREAVMSADRWEKPMGNTGLTNTHLIIRDDGWQAIADELNATLGSGTCEPKWTLQGKTQTQEFWRCECGNCGECFGVEDRSSFPFKMTIDEVDIPNYCPNCGKRCVHNA